MFYYFYLLKPSIIELRSKILLLLPKVIFLFAVLLCAAFGKLLLNSFLPPFPPPPPTLNLVQRNYLFGQRKNAILNKGLKAYGKDFMIQAKVSNDTCCLLLKISLVNLGHVKSIFSNVKSSVVNI